MEMGASAQLVVEANKTLPTDMNLLSKQQLIDFKVSFDPDHYGPWGIEAARNGLVAFSRSQDDKRQITIYCAKPHRPELLITYKDMDPSALEYLKSALRQIRKLALLQRTLMMTSTCLSPLTIFRQSNWTTIQTAQCPCIRTRRVLITTHENISLEGLTSAVQLSSAIVSTEKRPTAQRKGLPIHPLNILRHGYGYALANAMYLTSRPAFFKTNPAALG